MTLRRLQGALISYAALAVIAILVLRDWRFRTAVLVLLAGLALMSYTAYLRERQ